MGKTAPPDFCRQQENPAMQFSYALALLMAIAIVPPTVAIIRGVPVKCDFRASLRYGVKFSFQLLRQFVGRK